MKTVHSSPLRYLVVWAALVALTLLSFLASRAPLGAFEVVVALAIAAIKTVLVLLFFMHLVEQRLLHALVPFVCACFVVILVSLMVTDVATRHTFPPRPVPFVAGDR